MNTFDILQSVCQR